MTVKQQRYPNSCGAACLLCAAYELGLRAIPRSGGYTFWMAGPSPLAIDDASESKMYQVTSNNPRRPDPQNWGYSMPSGIVTCARMLGLQAVVVAYKTWTVRLLKIAYRPEIRRLRDLNALVEERSSRSALRPGRNTRELKVLATQPNVAGMHYVMVRPNGSVMEPATGRDYADKGLTKGALQMHGTGLSILVSS